MGGAIEMGKTGNVIRDLEERISKLEKLLHNLTTQCGHEIVARDLMSDSILVLQGRIVSLEKRWNLKVQG